MTGSGDWNERRLRWRGEVREWHMPIAIENIVCRKRNDVSGGKNMVNARFHQLANIKIVGVHKGSGGYPQHMLRLELHAKCAMKKFFRQCDDV